MTHGQRSPRTDRLRRVVLLIAAAVMGLALVPPAEADTPTAEEVRREIAALDSELAEVARDYSAMQERLAGLEREKRSQAAEIEEARGRSEAASAEIQEWAREAYKRGGDTYLAAMLAVGDLHEMAARSAYLERVADQARRTADAADAAAEDLQARLDELDSLEADARAALKDAEATRADLEAQQAKQQKILASIPPPAPPTSAPAPAPSSSSSSPTGQSGRSGGSGGGSQPQPPPPSGGGAGEIYEVTCYSDSGYTASGHPVGPGVAASDPRVIPLGTSFTIEGLGTYTAYDTGGAVKGKIVDIWNPSASWCRQFGRQRRMVVVHR